MKALWCIKNDKDEIWLQGWGWVNHECADCISVYEESEKINAPLPKGGSWALCWVE